MKMDLKWPKKAKKVKENVTEKYKSITKMIK